MNDTAKETQIGLKTKAFEMAQKFCLLFEDSDPQKVVDLAKDIYAFLASEDEAITKPEKDHILTTKPCQKCGCLRYGRKFPNGKKSQWDDCVICGYPKAKKMNIIRCRDCDCILFFDGKKQQPPPKYCPWCASENTSLGL